MGNHRIRYTPRDGWDGAETLKTLDLGAVPGFEFYRTGAQSSLSTRVSPGREYRSIAHDAWLEHSFELRAIGGDTTLYREITAFVSEADAGVEFEFAYDDTKTFNDTFQTFRLDFEAVIDPVGNPVGIVAVDDWLFCQAKWRRGCFGFYRAVTVGPATISIKEPLNFSYDTGSQIRHRGFVPKAKLVSHRLRKRRGGQGANLHDFRLTFREVA